MAENAPWRALEAGVINSGAEAEAPGRRSCPGALWQWPRRPCSCSEPSQSWALTSLKGGGQVELVSEPETSEVAVGPTGSQSSVVVQVAGAVLRPGVYSLPAGSRVGDAIKLAGGYSADVDPRLAETALNLAARVTDSEVILVPRRGDAAPASGGSAGGATAGSSSAGLIDLNTATAAQLDTLPGVGPATAAKIVAAREQARFTSVDDLVKRKVVTAAVLAKLRDLVTVR